MLVSHLLASIIQARLIRTHSESHQPIRLAGFATADWMEDIYLLRPVVRLPGHHHLLFHPRDQEPDCKFGPTPRALLLVFRYGLDCGTIPVAPELYRAAANLVDVH